MNEDFLDLLRSLLEAGADFVVVGAHAMAANGVSRATVDLDVFVQPSLPNAERVFNALVTFGAPLSSHGVQPTDFARQGTVYQMGLPPRRIDITTHIDGVSFAEAKAGQVQRTIASMTVSFLGIRELVLTKTAAGRPKDVADLELLREAGIDVDGLQGAPDTL